MIGIFRHSNSLPRTWFVQATKKESSIFSIVLLISHKIIVNDGTTHEQHNSCFSFNIKDLPNYNKIS